MESPGLINQSYISDLEKKVHMLTTFIDNSEAGMYVVDFYTGEVLFANRKTVALIGGSVSVDDIIGKICWQVMFPEAKARCSFCPYMKLLDSDGKPSAPIEWENLNELYGVWLKIISQAITWVDGRLALMMTFYNITKTKEMEARIAEHARQEEFWKMQQNLHTVLEHLPLPIRIADRESLTIKYVNKALLELFEYNSPKELLERKTDILLPPVLRDGTPAEELLYGIMHAEGINVTEMEYLTATGKLIPSRLINCTVDFNGRTSSVGIITDLSAEKEQARLLMQAAEREREANQLKSNFLSNMSHEIRTPMNAIIGLTEVELRKNLPQEAVDVYKKINISAKNLLQIINDILDLSKIEADRIELFPEEFELEDVLNSALLMASPKLSEKPVELVLDLSADMPRSLVGDRTRLWQILRNCLDNAAKFTASGSIILTVAEEESLSTEETVCVSFAVKDTGVGMNEAQLSKVFLPYEQFSDDPNSRHMGTGLGLPISIRLCELMGGTMQAESSPAKGTTMRFNISFGRSQQARPTSLQPLLGLAVLIVDDTEILLSSMEKLLKRCGAEYAAARSEAEALKIIRERQTAFDVILIDNTLDGASGLETAYRMRRELPEGSKVLLMAHESMMDKQRLAECGISNVIEKPFIPKTFIQKLRELAGKGYRGDNNAAEPRVMFTDTRVLVCEDNEINQDVAEAMLEQFGITTIFADNGRLGVEALEAGLDVRLVLMDLHMPVMNGYDAARAIRSNPKYTNLPIISLTADAMTETIDKCIEAGMNDFITKPIDFDHLYDVLRKWIPEDKLQSNGDKL